MKKLSTCVLSTGLAMLIGIGEVSAATSAIAKDIFGTDIHPLANETKTISNKLTEAKTSIAKASSTLENSSMNTKTFSPSVEVASPLVIAYNLDQGASVLEKISRALSILNDGLNTMNKSKSKGDINETNARNKIQHAVLALQAVEGLLPSVKANIAMLGKFIAKKTRTVSNAGEVEKTLRELIAKLSENKQKNFLFIKGKEKKCLINLMDEYQDNYQNIINSITDNRIKGWFEAGEKRIAKVKETLELFNQLLNAIVAYLNEQNPEQLVALAYECERELRPENEKLITQKVKNSFREENNNASLKRSNAIEKKGKKNKSSLKRKNTIFYQNNAQKSDEDYDIDE